ncbi:MAG: polysaccharide biosynthesis tyrosine autokinase [Pseudomonadota bacterium]
MFATDKNIPDDGSERQSRGVRLTSDSDNYSSYGTDMERGARDASGANPAPEPRISLTVVWNVLLIWKGIILLIVAAFVALGFIFLEFTTPVYKASASVMLGPRQTTILEDVENVVSGLNRDTATIQGEIEVMRSRDLTERVVRQLNLVDDTSYSPNARRFRDGAPEEEFLSEMDNLNSVIRNVGQSLSVRQVGLTTVIELSFSSQNPQKSALIADAFAQNYIDQQLEGKTKAIDDVAVALRERLEVLRARVQGAEQSLSNARASDVLVDGQTLETVDEQIKELSARLVQARVERISSEAQLDNWDRAQSLGRSLELLLEMRDAPVLERMALRREELRREIAGLQPRLLERHPTLVALRDELASVEAQIGVELEGQADRLQIEYDGALRTEGSLAENVRDLEAQKATVDDALQRVRELERAATIEQRLYESSLGRLREIDEQRPYLSADASIIERAAIPAFASSPNKRLIIAFATASGILVALGLVLVVETTRDNFTNPAALYVHTGVPVVGVLPKLKRLKIDHRLPSRLATTVSGREALESARRVHLTMLPRKRTGVCVLGITSALPGDGKTFCSMLLGHVSAGMDNKTLLIDADLRKPGVYPEINVPHFEGRGLTSLDPERDNLRAHTWRHPDMPLHILPADVRGKRIGFDEYSQIKKLNQVIEEARQDFDVIIVRMPPVVPSSDALSISSLLDELIFVVSWNKTKRGSVWKGLTDLASIDVYPTGMILNAADMKRSNQRDFYGRNFDYDSVQEYYS